MSRLGPSHHGLDCCPSCKSLQLSMNKAGIFRCRNCYLMFARPAKYQHVAPVKKVKKVRLEKAPAAYARGYRWDTLGAI